MTTNSVQLHRVLRTTPEKLYRAFTEAGAIARWLPPEGFYCTVHQMDARVGGTYRMSFTNFTTGNSHFFGGVYKVLEPHTRIVYTAKFEDPNMPEEMQTSITLKAVSCGTELTVVQSGISSLIPLEGCYVGWQESLGFLAKLVEPNIPE